MLASDVPVEEVVEELYRLISGPAGQAPDWDRFRALFAPGARMIPTNRETGGERAIRVQEVEEYIRSVGDHLTAHDFHERQTRCRVERFGRIAHAWSAYESRHTPDDPEPFMRGVNSIQLYDDGRRWWVVTVFWDSEPSGGPIRLDD